MSAKRNTAQKVPTDIALVVFGTDRRKKLHASRFGSDAAKSAQEAARTMGMRTLRIVSAAQREVASKLPKGTVSTKGKTTVPLVRPALYNKLLAIAGTEAAPPSSTSPADASSKPTTPADTKSGSSGDGAGLVRGSLVLATENLEEGWWPCAVQHVDGDVLTLRWEGFDLPKFNRKVSQVAPLPKAKPC